MRLIVHYSVQFTLVLCMLLNGVHGMTVLCPFQALATSLFGSFLQNSFIVTVTNQYSIYSVKASTYMHACMYKLAICLRK